MPRFVLSRLLQACVVLLAVSVLVFVGVFLIGNPVDVLISPEATAVERAQVTRTLGLDQPMWVQYGRFLGAALHGDFGKSFLAGQPAMGLIFQRLPATLELAVVAMLLGALIGVPCGLYAALQPRAWFARLSMTLAMLSFSVPTFWLGLMLVMGLAVSAGVLPSSGRGATVQVFGIGWSVLTLDGWQHLALPAITLATGKAALLARLTRATARDIVASDYVRFARAKGLRDGRIVGVHLLKNLMVPLSTVIGLEFGRLAAFSVITESIFAWPGIGKLLIDSIISLDRPVVVAYVMMVVFFLVLINLLVDLLYGVLDPRARLEARLQ